MSYNTNIRLLLKNINAKGFGTLNFEISFIHKDTKKKIRRYVNTNERLFKDDLRKYGIKRGENNKNLALLIDRQKIALTEQLRQIQIDNGEITPQLYDDAIRVKDDVKKDVFAVIHGVVVCQGYDRNIGISQGRYNSLVAAHGPVE